MISNFYKVEHSDCLYMSLKKSKNISLKIYLKALSRLTKLYIFYQCYSQ